MSDSGYTPSMGRVRHAATEQFGDRLTGEEFDRILAVHDAEKASRIAELEAVVKRAIHAAHTYPNLWDHIDSRDSFLAILRESGVSND